MMRVMDEYLLPAGYELQKVQHDFERLMQGKALFDRGTLETLAKCDNNNDRHQILSTIREYFIPNYDDVQGIYPELCRALVDAVRAARTSEPKPIESAFGTLSGNTAERVTTLAINLLQDLRYVDIDRTFQSLADIFRDEPEKDIRKHILQVIDSLARYNVHVWQQVGPAAQAMLVDVIAHFGPEDRVALRPLLLTVWRALLGSELRGTSFSADTITISTGAVPASDDLRAIRGKAISGLFELFDQSTSPVEQRKIFSALMVATCLPIRANCSSDLYWTVLGDTKRIVDGLSERVAGKPYDLLEHIEHEFLRHYNIARQLAEDEQDKFSCKDIAEDLTKSILAFRDSLNADKQFVRYKTLVGFESVFPPHWENDNFDFAEAEEYRRERVTEYIDVICDATEDEWHQLVARCAATESDDLATFPVFGEFLYGLSKAKPAIATRFLERGDAGVLKFMPAFLNGLADSGAEEVYRAVITRYLADGMHLNAIARHFRKYKTVPVASIKEVLNRAVSLNDEYAVIECLLLAVEQHEPQSRPLVDDEFVPAIEYLLARKDPRWVNGGWSLRDGPAFFSALSVDHATLVLKSLSTLSRIDHRVERILVAIALTHPLTVWEFIGQRLHRKREDEERYEAFPYQFHGLEQPLSTDVELAIKTVRSWFHAGDSLFRFHGGRLLAAVFPTFPDEFAKLLSDLAANSSDDDVQFILGILQNYKGEPATHPVLKALVNRLPGDDPRIAKVEISLQNTGVVGGEFGFVEAFQRKKAEMESWLQDDRPPVRTFAKEYIRKLDGRIASEQRSAEHRKELQKRAFEEVHDE